MLHSLWAEQKVVRICELRLSKLSKAVQGPMQYSVGGQLQ